VELRSYDSITPLSTRHITPGRKTASREPHKSHKEEDRRIETAPCKLPSICIPYNRKFQLWEWVVQRDR
jgi:hypothetical protein